MEQEHESSIGGRPGDEKGYTGIIRDCRGVLARESEMGYIGLLCKDPYSSAVRVCNLYTRGVTEFVGKGLAGKCFKINTLTLQPNNANRLNCDPDPKPYKPQTNKPPTFQPPSTSPYKTRLGETSPG